MISSFFPFLLSFLLPHCRKMNSFFACRPPSCLSPLSLSFDFRPRSSSSSSLTEWESERACVEEEEEEETKWLTAKETLIDHLEREEEVKSPYFSLFFTFSPKSNKSPLSLCVSLRRPQVGFISPFPFSLSFCLALTARPLVRLFFCNLAAAGPSEPNRDPPFFVGEREVAKFVFVRKHAGEKKGRKKEREAFVRAAHLICRKRSDLPSSSSCALKKFSLKLHQPRPTNLSNVFEVEFSEPFFRDTLYLWSEMAFFSRNFPVIHQTFFCAL